MKFYLKPDSSVPTLLMGIFWGAIATNHAFVYTLESMGTPVYESWQMYILTRVVLGLIFLVVASMVIAYHLRSQARWHARWPHALISTSQILVADQSTTDTGKQTELWEVRFDKDDVTYRVGDVSGLAIGVVYDFEARRTPVDDRIIWEARDIKPAPTLVKK